ncbi:class A beta-lactamase [Streptomyces diastatochromogenes]|nr:class A beta-lactamase [Streptomyces diastatochromogenes]
MTSASTPLPRRRLFQAGLALTTAAVIAPPRSRRPPRPTRGAERPTRTPSWAIWSNGTARGSCVRPQRAHRLDRGVPRGERFAMCSTFKAFAAAAVLRDHGGCAPLDRVIHYPPRDILPNSPKTEEHLATGMSVGDLCAAAIQYSDNAAGNLLLRQIGGPEGLTRFFRSLGDRVSRLDRWETDLNTAVPGDPRDTTTPEAIGRSFERLTLGRALDGTGREQLVTWLKGNTTSAERFGRGLPQGWVLGDKTGTGDYATANDIGVAWTTRGTPVVLAVLSTKAAKDAPVDNALVADTARLLARTLAPGE